jgi:hypothetical protein
LARPAHFGLALAGAKRVRVPLVVGSARHVLASGIKLEANVKAGLYLRPV